MTPALKNLRVAAKSGLSLALVFQLLFPYPASAETKTFSFGKGSIELVSNKDGIEINLLVSQADQAEILELQSPARLVLDLKGSSIKKNQTFALDNNHSLRTIRIGSHPDKIRIVVDFSSPTVPHFEKTESTQKLSFRFTDSVKSATTFSVPAITAAIPAKTTNSQEQGPQSKPKPSEHQETPISNAANDKQAKQLPLTKNPTASPAPKVEKVVSATPTAPVTPAATATATASPSATATRSATPTAPPTAVPSATATATKSATPIPTASPKAVISVLRTSPSPAESSQQEEKQVSLPNSPTPRNSPSGLAQLNDSGTAAANQRNRILGDQRPSASTGQSLSSMQFSFLSEGHAPVLRLALKNRAEYKLSRLSDKEYQLSIPSAKLDGSYIGLPQFPPRDFLGINMIQARENGSNVEVRILVDRGVKVSAYAKDNEIWIKPLSR